METTIPVRNDKQGNPNTVTNWSEVAVPLPVLKSFNSQVNNYNNLLSKDFLAELHCRRCDGTENIALLLEKADDKSNTFHRI